MPFSAAAEAFRTRLGAEPTLEVRSPGRVNLIGEHTDYNDGFVFPAALSLGTTVVARRRDDGRLRAFAAHAGSLDEAPLADLRAAQAPGWTKYVRGTAHVLREAGRDPCGADLFIDGDLPLGSGLSSSASLEIGLLVALAELAGNPIDRREMARLGRRVENEVVGVQSGIMDQLAVALGEPFHALLIDCRSLESQSVRLPEDVRLLVLDSAAPRTLAFSAYNQRRRECEAALAALRELEPGLQALRDVTPELLERGARGLGPVERRRARHVVSENARVLSAVAALRSGDAERFGQLMDASHRSLRDDYEVSSPQLDLLVELAADTRGVQGARLTGAGFGGCVVALARARHADEAAASIVERYRSRSSLPGRGWACSPGDGARVVARA